MIVEVDGYIYTIPTHIGSKVRIDYTVEGEKFSIVRLPSTKTVLQIAREENELPEIPTDGPAVEGVVIPVITKIEPKD